MPFHYKIEVLDRDLEIYSVLKTDTHDKYELRKTVDGGFDHEPMCKALTVYGPQFLCRHKKMVLGKYYAAEEYKYLFNISPPRKKKI